jgi:tetratricopeptide (TPR) repeat protein
MDQVVLTPNMIRINKIESDANEICNKGKAYHKQKRYAEAIAEFRKAIQIMPKFGHFYCGLSDAYAGNKEYEKALAIWNAVDDIQFYEGFDKAGWIESRRAATACEVDRIKALYRAAEHIVPYIINNPGCIQKDLYKIFLDLRKEDISSALWQMAHDHLIERSPVGSSYKVSALASGEKILSVLKF